MSSSTDTAPLADLEEAEGPAHRHLPLVSGYGRERPLAPYAMLATAYAACAAVGVTSAVRRRGKLGLPSPGDAALLAVAAFKLSRVIAKDKITSFARAPFTRFVEEGDGPEVNEAPRGEGVRRAIGELVTCPFCFTQWSATILGIAYLHAPRATRAAAGLLTVVAAADVLHVGWTRLESSGR